MDQEFKHMMVVTIEPEAVPRAMAIAEEFEVEFLGSGEDYKETNEYVLRGNIVQVAQARQRIVES